MVGRTRLTFLHRPRRPRETLSPSDYHPSSTVHYQTTTLSSLISPTCLVQHASERARDGFSSGMSGRGVWTWDVCGGERPREIEVLDISWLNSGDGDVRSLKSGRSRDGTFSVNQRSDSTLCILYALPLLLMGTSDARAAASYIIRYVLSS